MWLLLLHMFEIYDSSPSIQCYWLYSPPARRKSFSLTQIHRNLDTGRSSAAGLLPQAEVPRSPWQPRHSDGQPRVRVGRAAAFTHRPAALIRQRAGITATSRPVFQLSFTFSSVCLWKSKWVFVFIFFKVSRGSVCSTCLGERQSRWPRGSESLMLHSVCHKTPELKCLE